MELVSVARFGVFDVHGSTFWRLGKLLGWFKWKPRGTLALAESRAFGSFWLDPKAFRRAGPSRRWSGSSRGLCASAGRLELNEGKGSLKGMLLLSKPFFQGLRVQVRPKQGEDDPDFVAENETWTRKGMQQTGPSSWELSKVTPAVCGATCNFKG